MSDVFSAPAAETAAQDAEDLDLTRARAGDDAAFTRLVTPLRRQLHAHCYRMPGSAHDAEEDGSLPTGLVIARRFDRSSRWGGWSRRQGWRENWGERWQGLTALSTAPPGGRPPARP
ncbi:hypothetical protein [Nonomuraea sp. 10N515B]|uniref:hypothetical protein n=1 Tax=Nonomuraea sp. 10N515B TaxID=3457422 RepID=UPI003FCDFA12